MTLSIIDLNIHSFSLNKYCKRSDWLSCDDLATFKLVDQEDKKDEDLLPQAASQDDRPDDLRA